MHRLALQQFLIVLLFFTVNVQAQTIYDSTSNNPSASGQGMAPADFKTGVTSSWKSILAGMTSDLQQQLINYRALHPVTGAPTNQTLNPSNAPTNNLTSSPGTGTGTSTASPAATTPATNAPAPSTYTGFGTSKANPLYSPSQRTAPPANTNSNQWNVKY